MNIKKITESYPWITESYPWIIPDAFAFSTVSLGDVKNEIWDLGVRKSSSSKAIPVAILKQSAHIDLPFLTNSIILYVKMLFQMNGSSLN